MPFDSEPQTPNREQDGESESTEEINRTSSGEGFNTNGVITLDKNRIAARLASMGKDEEDESGGDWEEGGGSSRYDLLDYGEETSQKKREAFHADGACECTHACMHYVCACANLCVCVCTCYAYVNIHAHMSAFLCLCVYGLCVCMDVFVCARVIFFEGSEGHSFQIEI